jgi:hypothetical protein
MKKSVAIIAVVAALVVGFGLGSWVIDTLSTSVLDLQYKLIAEQEKSLSLQKEKTRLLEEKFYDLGIDPYEDHIIPQETGTAKTLTI